jgi:hypothetical protein
MVALPRKVLPVKKSQSKGGEASAGGEFGIDVSGDLDLADWLPDLHQDTPPFPAIFSPLNDLVPLLNGLHTSADLLASRGISESGKMLGRMHASDRTWSGSSLGLSSLQLLLAPFPYDCHLVTIKECDLQNV